MKALLIIDMPPNCADCDFSEWRKDQDWEDGDYCSLNGGQCLNCKRPDSCPLRPLPEPMEVCGKYPQQGRPIPSYRIGWNACLDKITEN